MRLPLAPGPRKPAASSPGAPRLDSKRCPAPGRATTSGRVQYSDADHWSRQSHRHSHSHHTSPASFIASVALTFGAIHATRAASPLVSVTDYHEEYAEKLAEAV